MYKIRFNLGRGKNYMKWKVTYPSGAVRYYEPSEYTLEMKICLLRNQKGTAKKIFEGANKTVCAWVQCEEFKAFKNPILRLYLNSEKVSYNPRKAPHWVYKNQDADNTIFDKLLTEDREILFAY